MPNRWFQLSLVTLVVFVIVVAIVMLLNFMPRMEYWTGFNSENFEVSHEDINDAIHTPGKFGIRRDYEWRQHQFGEERHFGWPFKFVTDWKLVYFTDAGWKPAPDVEQIPHPLNWYYDSSYSRNLIWDLVIWVGILFLTIIAVESCARRVRKSRLAASQPPVERFRL